MITKRRVLALGLDGLAYSLVKELTAQGRMRNFASLIENRPLVQMDSVLPTVSSVAWACFAAARNPGKCGVFGFTELDQDLSIRFPDSRDLAGATIWEVLGAAGKRIIGLSAPMTHPPRSVPNGMLVSCFLADGLSPETVTPRSMFPLLSSAGYRIDTDPTVAWSDRDAFLADVNRVFEGRCRALDALLSRDEWDFLLLHVMETDRLGHFFLKDYAEQTGPYAQVVPDFLEKVDRLIGDVAGRLPSDAALMILSDHGFCPVIAEFQVNRWLTEQGYLSMEEGAQAHAFAAIRPQSRAVSLVPGRIYLLRNRQLVRFGEMNSEDAELATRISGELAEVMHPASGVPVIRRTARPDEVYDGPQTQQAPVLLLDPNDGFDLKAALSPGELYTNSPVTGMHTFHDAHLWFSEPFTTNSKPRVFDAPQLVFDTLSIPLPKEADCRGICLTQ